MFTISLPLRLLQEELLNFPGKNTAMYLKQERAFKTHLTFSVVTLCCAQIDVIEIFLEKLADRVSHKTLTFMDMSQQEFYSEVSFTQSILLDFTIPTLKIKNIFITSTGEFTLHFIFGVLKSTPPNRHTTKIPVDTVADTTMITDTSLMGQNKQWHLTIFQ